MPAKKNIAIAIALLYAAATSAYAAISQSDIEKFTTPSGLSASLDGRKIVIHSGTIQLSNKVAMAVPETEIDLPRCTDAVCLDEPFDLVRANSKDPGLDAWQHAPKAIKLGGVPFPNILNAESLLIKTKPGNPHIRNFRVLDYKIDPKWGLLMAGDRTAAEVQHVYIDYSVKQRRIYTAYLSKSGSVKCAAGQLSKFAPEPPPLPDGATPILSVLAPPSNEDLKKTDIL